MELPPFVPSILKSATGYRDRLGDLRDIVLANAVMCGEIPSPTFHEERLAQFLTDRFTESGLESSMDEMGNVSGILPGSIGERNVLVAAHIDTIWDRSVDHTVTATGESMKAPGLADNSLGAGVIASLPFLLERLDIQLRSNLILLGTTRSLGEGNLEGIRFFLDNTKVPVHGGLCIEGAQLGRLSYSCQGMVRAEVSIKVPEHSTSKSWSSSDAIIALTQVVDRMLSIERPERPKTVILLGSINAGSGYNVPPKSARLRFEVRSEDADIVSKILTQIEEILEEVTALGEAKATLSVIARRDPGDLGFSHPLVRSARAVMEALDLKPEIVPSTSELSALLAKDIPSLTLGLTTADHTHTVEETVHIDPLYSGMAQLVCVLQIIDQLIANEQHD